MGLPLLQAYLVPADGCHPVHIAVADLLVQGGDNLVFPGQEARAGEIDAGDGVVGDEGAVAGQILHK